MTKQAILARPRGFCAGVIRAMETVELALKGVTAGASTPEELVRELLSRLYKLGVASVIELDGEQEALSFALPAALTRAIRASA